MRCLKCSSEAIVKNGHMKGLQRYKCKQCAYQFTQETPRGKPMKDKILAIILYLSGLSMNMIAQIVGVSTQSVMRWIKLFYAKYAEIPTPDGNIQEIEIDEMHHYIGKKKHLLWIWKIIDHHSKQLIGWKCGDRSSQTLNALCEEHDVLSKQRVYTDNYSCYADIIGARSLRQGKRNTYKIEQNNAQQRHWLGRFRRRTQIVSKSIEMIHASLALFARFRVNGNISELISLLR